MIFRKKMENSIKNIDTRVDYSTVYFSMHEERSAYADIALVKFSALIKAVMKSFNNLIYLVFWALPYAIAILLIMWIRKLTNN